MFKRIACVLVTAAVASILSVGAAAPAHASVCEGGTPFTGTVNGSFTGAGGSHWRTSIKGMTEIEFSASRSDVQVDMFVSRPDGTCTVLCWYRYAGSGFSCTAAGAGEIFVLVSYNGITPINYRLTERNALFSGLPCNDTRDNDYDGAADYPADPDCTSQLDPMESSLESCDTSTGVSVCYRIEQGPVTTALVAYGANVVPATVHSVRGVVDVYRFSLPGGASTTLPCPSLSADGESANPCADAGGTFVSRLATLVDETVTQPTVGISPLATVQVCPARVSLTVQGIGVENVPLLATC